MIPLCMIVGDSTAVGTSAAIAMSGIQCETYARVGASSAGALRSAPNTLSASLVVIALGSNDPDNPGLHQNLAAVRRKVTAPRVVWLAPYNAVAAAAVGKIAAVYGDSVVPLTRFPSQDGIHPISYRTVARALNLPRSELIKRQEQRTLPLPRPSALVRQAVVLRF